MNCKISTNILKSDFCGYSLPEILDLYLINFDELSGTQTATGAQTDCESVSAITLESGAKVYKIEPNEGSATFTDTLTIANNGSKYRVHSVTWTNPGQYTDCAHTAMDNLALGRYVVVVHTAEGSYLMLGRISGLTASEQTLGGGADGAGVSTTLSGNAAESVIPLSESAVTTLLGAVYAG